MAEEKKGLSRFFKWDEKKQKKAKLIVVALLCVIIVGIFLSTIIPKKESTKNESNGETKTFLSMEYCHQLENKLENVLGEVKGIGKIKVFVMVSESPTYRYLEETNSQTNGNQTSSQTTVYESKNGSAVAPVVVVEELPEILGVLIIASGAKDLKLQNTITNVVSSILAISVSKVEVLEGRG